MVKLGQQILISSRLAQTDNGNRENNHVSDNADLNPTSMQKTVAVLILVIIFVLFNCFAIILFSYFSFFLYLVGIFFFSLLYIFIVRLLFVFDEKYGVSNTTKWLVAIGIGILAFFLMLPQYDFSLWIFLIIILLYFIILRIFFD